MKKEDNVVRLSNPAEFVSDSLTEIARIGAQKLLACALEAEVNGFIEQHNQCKTSTGHQRIVRNGYLPERTVQTGIGEIPIKQPRVRDKMKDNNDITQFTSSIIPPYLRRSKSIETLMPLLYLKGISTGDFREVLTPLLGDSAKGASHSTVSRLKSVWESEYQVWCKRDLSLKNYVYWWADGIYLQARMEDAKDCVLVIIGVNEMGKKELIAIEDGYRESKESWQTLIRDVKARGLTTAPKVAVGDGALGFWSALSEEFPKTRHQRCWVHKMVNVLDKMPQSVRAKAKSMLQEIWMAEERQQAIHAFEHFIASFGAKYEKACNCLNKDRDELLTFYDFPALHWKPLRTTNPIESTFATVRHRTKKSKGCFSRKTILTMVFKLCQSAQEKWIRLNGFAMLADVIKGVKFIDGISEHELQKRDQTVAA